MMIQPHAASGTPVYVQLMEQVKHGLRSGALKAGETLPDIVEVATSLVVNPGSVARAYRHLASEGVIEPNAERGGWRYGFAAASSPAPNAPAAQTRLRDRYASELLAAREVQQHFFPGEAAAVEGLEYAGVSRPALAVGGDYYDFIPLTRSTIAFAIGDVCGKGVPAALLMATLRAALRAQVRAAARPCDIVTTVNRLVCDSFTSNRFATLFYGHLDAASGRLDYVNAGHLPPLIQSCAAAVPLTTGGPVIGLSPACRYEQGQVHLDRGDRLVGFTDGITEGLNRGGEEFGEVRVAAAATACRSPRQTIASVLAAVDRFTGPGAQGDDMTLIALRLTADGGDAVPA